MNPTDFVPLTLRAHAVRLTPSRRQVLDVLLASQYALSSSEIERQAGPVADRVTFFRALRLLEQKGLIHRVIDYAETVRFAVAPALRSPAEAAAPLPAEHVHFKCIACQHIYCLPHVPVPDLPVPEHYQVQRRDCLLSGVCAHCRPPATTLPGALASPAPIDQLAEEAAADSPSSIGGRLVQ